ncbi:response regulator transcription factor [Gorillibacterium sp. sgz5001074]|uniref:response regulator transcription factor n=1 Tax=Gorillibacterium sp. sgz5001074 TaxID=3446695 RepID=UPI003F665066
MHKVLIVDDMDIVRIMAKRLKLWGRETGFELAAEASDGREALAILEEIPIDLVITDVKMPGMDGFELLRHILDRKLCPCVVLLSDFADLAHARQGFLSGAFDYMAKPLEEAKLKEVFGRALPLLGSLRANRSVQALPKTRILEELYREGMTRIQAVLTESYLQLPNAALELLERLETECGHDQSTMEFMLRRLHKEMLELAVQRYGWLRYFVSCELHPDPDLFRTSRYQALHRAFLEEIRRMTELTGMLLIDRLPGNDLVDRVCQCCLEHADRDLSVAFIAERLYMNKTYISEVFKRRTGIPLNTYLTFVKMERARKLMDDGRLKIYEISDSLGFRDAEYFSRLFKKHTGATPAQYRNIRT